MLATRRHKPEVEHGRFDDDWKAEADAAGWGPDAAERLVGWSPAAGRHRRPTGGGGSTTVVFDEHGQPEHAERIVDPRSGSPTCCAPS